MHTKFYEFSDFRGWKGNINAQAEAQIMSNVGLDACLKGKGNRDVKFIRKI
jgi:hypothetical protein